MKPTIDFLARRYVSLALALGAHDPYLIDAYFGPANLRPRAGLSLKTVERELIQLRSQLAMLGVGSMDQDLGQRVAALSASARALQTRIRLVKGERISLAEEALNIYELVIPSVDHAAVAAAQHRLTELLPGTGELWQRLETLEAALYVPEAQVLRLFEACVDTVRSKSLQQIRLPGNETFSIELVRGEPWSAYNWFKGAATSHIQLNVDVPIVLPRLLHLAAHEGYPGHHAHHSLMEQEYLQRRGWVEFSVYPLYGPQAVIAEGIADTGLDLLLNPEQRIEFEVAQLAGEAGVSREAVRLYHAVAEIVCTLRHVELAVADRYLRSTLTTSEAVQELVQHALLRPDRAQKRMQFIERYRAYVCTYACGKELVSSYVFNQPGGPDETDLLPEVLHWQRFKRLMNNIVLPSALAEAVA